VVMLVVITIVVAAVVVLVPGESGFGPGLGRGAGRGWRAAGGGARVVPQAGGRSLAAGLGRADTRSAKPTPPPPKSHQVLVNARMCGITGYEGPLTCGNISVLDSYLREEGCVAKPWLPPSCQFASQTGSAAY
jgi:hypothetical protein